MIGGLEPIESNLHRHLTEHLNAEVVLQTITDLDVAMRWLSSTFLYIRASKNPRHYGLTGDASAIDRRLLGTLFLKCGDVHVPPRLYPFFYRNVPNRAE
jgi:replicative superfamily II helicase